MLGCGERCKTRDQLEQALTSQEINPGPYEWYLQLKELAPMQTSGFGLGVERFVQWISGAEDIRDCSLWLRDHRRSLDP